MLSSLLDEDLYLLMSSWLGLCWCYFLIPHTISKSFCPIVIYSPIFSILFSTVSFRSLRNLHRSLSTVPHCFLLQVFPLKHLFWWLCLTSLWALVFNACRIWGTDALQSLSFLMMLNFIWMSCFFPQELWGPKLVSLKHLILPWSPWLMLFQISYRCSSGVWFLLVLLPQAPWVPLPFPTVKNTSWSVTRVSDLLLLFWGYFPCDWTLYKPLRHDDSAAIGS